MFNAEEVVGRRKLHGTEEGQRKAKGRPISLGHVTSCSFRLCQALDALADSILQSKLQTFGAARPEYS